MAEARRAPSALTENIPDWILATARQTMAHSQKTNLYADPVWGKQQTVFAVRTGAVIETETRSKKVRFVNIHGPGDFFGFQNLFVPTGEERTERMVTAVTMPDTEIAYWFAPELENAASANGKIAVFLMQAALKMALRREGFLQTLTSLKRLQHKLIFTLIDLGDRLGETDHRSRVTISNPTHERIAGIIGCTREQTTDILNELRRMGMIDYSRTSITILKRSALEDMIAH